MASPLAGARLIRKDGSAAAASALDGKVVVLYFSAGWCPPCHRFTPVLADFYDEVKQSGGNIEIVYVPGDRSKPEMMEYFVEKHADYLAVDLSDSHTIQALNQRYSIRGIPSVVVIQPDGTPIDTEARGAVQSRGPSAFLDWKAKWQGSTFAGTGHTLGGGGGSGTSRLLAPAPQAYDEEAAIAAAIKASLETPSASITAPSTAEVALARTRSDEERQRRAVAEDATMLAAADSDALDAELAVTQMELQYTKVDAAVAALQEKNTGMIVRTAVELLVKILSNVAKDPSNPKFRRIRKDNKQISGKVLVARGALSLLLSVGFTSVDNFLVMEDADCDVVKIGHSIRALESVLAGQAAAQQAERERQMAALREDAAKKKARRDQLKAAVQGDKVARQDPNWKAKTFEKSGKEITRFSDIGVDLDSGGG